MKEKWEQTKRKHRKIRFMKGERKKKRRNG